MTFDQIPAGAAVFLDANSLVYHFTNDPKYGVASTRLVLQAQHGALSGFTSTDVLADVAHCALSYFFDHRDEILALISAEEQAHAQFGRP